MPSYYLISGYSERGITHRGFIGITSASVLILEDGFRLTTPDYESFQFDKNYPLEDMYKVELFHGSAGSLFGAGAFSGIVSIEREQQKSKLTSDLPLDPLMKDL